MARQKPAACPECERSHEDQHDPDRATPGDRGVDSDDPVLNQLVHIVRAGLLSREVALMHAVLGLSKIRATQHQQLVDLLNTSPVPLTLPVTPWG